MRELAIDIHDQLDLKVILYNGNKVYSFSSMVDNWSHFDGLAHGENDSVAWINTEKLLAGMHGREIYNGDVKYFLKFVHDSSPGVTLQDIFKKYGTPIFRYILDHNNYFKFKSSNQP